MPDDSGPGESVPEASGESVVGPHAPHRLPPRRPPTREEVATDTASRSLPSHLFDRPVSVFVYGSSRPLVNLVLYALAARTNPDFHWVDIGDPTTERAPCDPVQLGWISDDRLWRVERPEMLRPDDRNDHLPLFRVIRPDEPSESLARFTEFLSLPDQSQQILATRPPPDRPGVVVVSNAHRAGDAFAPSRVATILNAHRNAGFSVMVGYAGSASPERDLFEFVFRLDGVDNRHEDWKENQLVCEKGIRGGPLGSLSPVRLEEVPLVAEIVMRARPFPWTDHSHESS
jgi:hypothetical protein